MKVDGEMQVNFALNNQLRDEKYPFTRLKGENVNTLIFPNLSSANNCYKLLQALDPGNRDYRAYTDGTQQAYSLY